MELPNHTPGRIPRMATPRQEQHQARFKQAIERAAKRKTGQNERPRPAFRAWREDVP